MLPTLAARQGRLTLRHMEVSSGERGMRCSVWVGARLYVRAATGRRKHRSSDSLVKSYDVYAGL